MSIDLGRNKIGIGNIINNRSFSLTPLSVFLFTLLKKMGGSIEFIGAGIGVFSMYILMRWGFFGHTTVRIPLDEQGKSTSYGKNWFSVKSGLLYNEAVEYEEWESCRELRVGSYGMSIKPIKLSFSGISTKA